MNFVTGGMLNKSALLTAAGKGNLRQVRTLLEGNPGLIAHKSLHGNNALHNAAANGHCDMVIWLVEHGGARPELVDGEGRTALMRARNNNHTAVVEYLRNYCSAGDGDSRNGNDIRVETTGAAPPSLLSSIGSGLKTLGSSTKKAMGIGIGRLSISLPAGVMYMPGRDSIEGVIQLVDVPEPIQGQSLTVRLEAYRKVVRYNNEGRAVHSNQQEYSDGYELAAAQQYVNNEQFRFRLRVPVIERRLAQGQDSGTLMGSFLGAVDSVRAVSRNPLQWKVTASLSIPLCWGMGGAVHVAVAEPGQEVAHTPARTRMHRPAPAQHVPAAAAAAAAATTTTPPSEGMVPANGHLCNICYMEEHDPDVLAVACDNGHYLCETCFASWVESQSDIDGNPQKVILNQGKIHCVCRESSNCNSEAFRNKLIACAFRTKSTSATCKHETLWWARRLSPGPLPKLLLAMARMQWSRNKSATCTAGAMVPSAPTCADVAGSDPSIMDGAMTSRLITARKSRVGDL